MINDEWLPFVLFSPVLFTYMASFILIVALYYRDIRKEKKRTP